jgi:amino acid adenylation domain-containing protein
MKKDLEFKVIEFDPFAARGELSRTAPATEGQTEIWTSLVMSPIATLAYNESIAVTVPTALDPHRLQTAIDLLVQKHDALRMSISPMGRTLFIAKQLTLPLRIIDLTNDLMQDRLMRWQTLREEATREAFTIENAPLLRVSLVKFSANDSRILLSAHHLVCDGWSLAVILQDLAKAYSDGSLANAPSFADYALAEQQSLDTKAANYWQQIYKDGGSVLELPIANQRPAVRSFESRRADKALRPELVKALKDLARKHRVSYVAMQMSAFAVLLGRLSDSHDISIGMPSAGQASQGLERLIGHCVHLLPMRIQLKEGETFASLLTRSKKALLDAYDHQSFTFGELLKSLKIQRDPSRIPLVSVMFNVDTKLEASDVLFDSIGADYDSNPRFAENFEIFINITESKKETVIECQYNSALFTAERIELILDSYTRLLQSLAADAEQAYEKIAISSTKVQNLSKWNDTKKDYPREKSLVDLLRDACIHNGSRIAIEAGDGKLSYTELWEQSGKLRDRLRSQAVKKGDRVGLCLSRSTRMVVAQLAILRAGALYVPLDPSFPKDRIDYMVQDADMQTIVCEEGTRSLLPAAHSTVIWEAAADAPHSDDITVAAEDAAYMIYTSGSTGRPKGVVIGHRAVVNFLLMMTERLNYKTHARLLAVTTLSFDIAVLEIFMPLLNRGTIILASDSSRKDGFVLAKILESEKIDVMQATPSTWRMLLSLDWKPKASLTILCGGEAFPPDLRNDLVPTASAVWNLYGPTEATVWVTAKHIRMTDPAITVGRPIGNTRLHILDKNRQVLPQGIKGEVYIAGDALAEGYWRRPELDAEKFIQDVDGEARLYQTGDIGRINSDGELEIMGRVDAQIKLRGYRIELGEIESSMLENSAVRAGTVVLREHTPGNPQIIAYLVWSHGERLSDLRASMSKHLPDYMMPQSFVVLDKLPLLPNGKIDRKSLPSPLTPPTAELEQTAVANESFSGQTADIAELWKKALGRNTVASNDDFFLVGGHSLLAIQLLAQINKRFACQLTLRDIFQFPKFEAFSRHVLTQAAVKIEAIPASSDNRLSFAQERMWYVEQLSPGPVHNLPGAWILHGKFDRTAWQRALNALCETHDVLGMALGLESGAPVRAMKNLATIDCPLIDLSDLPGAEAQSRAVTIMEDVAMTAFELDRAPLIKFALYKINDEKHIFFINVHHMIWDGWCFDLFWSHMNTLYQKALKGELGPQKPMSPNYADFSSWQRAKVDARGESYQYWTQLYKTVPDALDLPIDYPRPAMLEAAGDTLLVPWSKDANSAFELQSKSQEATPFMLAMAVLVFTLHRLSGQNDIVIGTPVRGRTRSEFESLLGLFINVLPLRFQIDPSQSFASLLKQVQKVCMDGFAHQDYPFETLLAEVKVPRDESRTPLFTAMFSYQDVSERVVEMPDIKIEQIFVGGHGIPTDIVFWMKKSEGKLDMGIDFRTKLWNRDSVQSFAEIYKSLQAQSASNPQLPLEGYTLFPAEQMPRIKPATVNLWSGPSHETLADALWQTLSKHSKSRIRSGHDSYSYDGISRKASAIAAELLRRGVKPGDRVGLCCDRSIELLQGMFGIMLAGAAYVPFDPNAPRDRLKSMCEQADLSLVVTQEDWLDILPLDAAACIIVSETKTLDDEAFQSFSTARPRLNPKDPAYVIFTSGSTGTPKAVQISHGAAIHFLEGIQKSLNLRDSDICLALTTVTFDISVLEIFGALLQGSTIILAESAYAADGEALARLIRDEKISFMQATPSGYRILLDSGWTGSPNIQAITGGEALPRDLLDRLLSRAGRLWNAYGPTEATVWATIELMSNEGAITIGRPLPGYETFILNEQRQLQPIGAWGELFIGGPSLADGYLKDEIKTKDRFIPHSLSKAGRLYATGDIVRLRSDGRLEFKARLDTQVKIRGYRIELEEIETIVSKDSRIRSTAAKVWEPTPGDQRLVLYFVSDEALTMTDLQTTFRSFLPKYMWPTHVERLKALPLTANGKLDRRSLPLPDFSAARATSKKLRTAETASEKAVATIWQELLHVKDVGLDDNFFDLGGHSLLTLKMLARINESFGKNLKLRDVLTATLGQLASLVSLEEKA